MIAYKCDRCGKLFEEDDIKTIISKRLPHNIYVVNTRLIERHIDFCKDCAKEFADWFNYYSSQFLKEAMK